MQDDVSYPRLTRVRFGGFAERPREVCHSMKREAEERSRHLKRGGKSYKDRSGNSGRLEGVEDQKRLG